MTNRKYLEKKYISLILDNLDIREIELVFIEHEITEKNKYSKDIIKNEFMPNIINILQNNNISNEYIYMLEEDKQFNSKISNEIFEKFNSYLYQKNLYENNKINTLPQYADYITNLNRNKSINTSCTGKIENLKDYLDVIISLKKEYNSEEQIFYRGQSSIDYDLQPSVFREKFKDEEDQIYLKILSECSNEFNDKMYHIDILSKMQHYEVPTRLLDITTNPLVALYFACTSKEEHSKDGKVFVFNPSKDIIKQFDSDTVSILSSIPRLDNNTKYELYSDAEIYKIRNNLRRRYPSIDIDYIKRFNEKDPTKKLLHEIKKEKPQFENIINPEDLLKNYFVLPKKNNPRIIKQSGAFIIYGLEDKSKFNADYEIIISAEYKEIILKQLDCFGISKATLFPELYKVAEYVKDGIKNP